MQVAWLTTINGLSSGALRLWSGLGTLTFNGNSYQGTQNASGALISVSPITDSIGAPNKRAEVSFYVDRSVLRDMLDIDIGPVRVAVDYIYSTTEGSGWQSLAGGFRGFLSRPRWESEMTIYVVELETWGGDVDRGQPLVWSDEHQQQRSPGDLGFSFMRGLEAEGLEIKWPP